jgi:hypothetical protein
LCAEDEINVPLTERAREDVRYKRYLEWLQQNGAKMHPGIALPTAFGPLGVIGVAATQNIPPNTCVMAIPNRLLISCLLVDESEVAPIIKKHEDFFDAEDDDDADFNKLALFVMYERNKGKQSFWHPFFDVIDSSYTQLEWKKPEIKLCQDEYQLKSVWEFRRGMEETWETFKGALKEFPKLFPKGTYSRESFFWAY